mgnify:CR=1 FL=1
MKNMTREREAHGWTRMELGFRTRIHPSRIGAIELARVVPYPVELERIVEALGWKDEPDLLLEEVDDVES